tara:strand:- start:2173 stop:2934 length:762 start_codon:yes stop_codon:yes gene_type:complete
MSKIKVTDIAPTTSNTPSITLGTNSNVTFANGVTATSFTGDGANLTNVPAPSTYDAANLTGTIPDASVPNPLPAIDGSALTGIAAGGALEFSSKTTISVSSSTTQINFFGLQYDSIYKVVVKLARMSGTGEPNIYLYRDGSINTSYYIDYVSHDPCSNQRYNPNSQFIQVYTCGYEDKNWEYEMTFSTGYHGWFRGTGHPNGNNYAAGWTNWWGHWNPSYYATSRISGISLRHSNNRTFDTPSEVILYKLKES